MSEVQCIKIKKTLVKCRTFPKWIVLQLTHTFMNYGVIKGLKKKKVFCKYYISWCFSIMLFLVIYNIVQSHVSLTDRLHNGPILELQAEEEKERERRRKSWKKYNVESCRVNNLACSTGVTREVCQTSPLYIKQTKHCKNRRRKRKKEQNFKVQNPCSPVAQW